MTDDDPIHDVEELVDELSDRDEWDVTDYTFDGGKFDAFETTVTLEWQPPTERLVDEHRLAKRVIERHEDEQEVGAKKADVLTELKAEGIDTETAKAAIKRLRSNGDVYEPHAGVLRVV